MTGRALWVTFCCAMAAFWLVAGFFTLGLAWLLIIPSLLAILLPVGKPPKKSFEQLQADWPRYPPKKSFEQLQADWPRQPGRRP